MSRLLLDTHALLWFVANDSDEQMRTNGFTYLPIAPAHVFRAAALPLHHRDPFDRMLIAQALVEGLSLVTRDDFRSYGVAATW